jgi:hypothetical protein
MGFPPKPISTVAPRAAAPPPKPLVARPAPTNGPPAYRPFPPAPPSPPAVYRPASVPPVGFLPLQATRVRPNQPAPIVIQRAQLPFATGPVAAANANGAPSQGVKRKASADAGDPNAKRFKQATLAFAPSPMSAAAPANAVAPANAAAAPIPADKFRQTHLGVRAHENKDAPTLAIREIHDNQFGQNAHTASKSSKEFSANYREPQTQYLPNSGGSGLDEMVSTATVATLRGKLAKRLSPGEVEKVIGRLSEEREYVSNLGWATGKPETPLGSHPGGLSKSQTSMQRGLTRGHGSRDRLRAKQVMAQFDSGLSVNKDPSRIVDETSVMALVMTVNHFMQPLPQLLNIDVSTAANNAYHPRYGWVIVDKKKTEAFERMANAIHENRERRKIEAAFRLNALGYGDLLSPELQKLVSGEEKTWEEVWDKLSKKEEKTPDYGPPKSQAAIPATGTLDEWKAEKGKLIRAISDPRSIVKPKPVAAGNTAGANRT